MIDIVDAIRVLDPNAWVGCSNNDINQIHWHDGNPNKLTKEQIQAKYDELVEADKKLQYQRDRLAEYPSIQELVVALYDADDKAEIDKKRAEIKKKYPKPE